MAYLYGDGFDHYGTDANLLLRKYANMGLVTNPVRTGGYAVHLGQSGHITFEQASSSAFIGWSNYGDNLAGGNGEIFESAVGDMFTVTYEGDGSMMIRAGNFGTLLAQSAPNLIQRNTYQFVEVGWLNVGPNATITVRLNNTQICQALNANLNAAPQNITGRRTGLNSVNRYMDDYHEGDFTGVFPENTFFGDLRQRLRTSTANGPLTSWAANGDANAWQCLNHIPTIPATNFISSATVGDVSNFVLQNLPTNVAFIAGYTVFLQGYKSDAGTGALNFGIDSQGSVAHSPSTALGTANNIYVFSGTNDPLTGSPFTLANAQQVITRVERTA